MSFRHGKLPLSPSARPTPAAFQMTKHPTPNPFWLWIKIQEGDGGTQTGTALIFMSPCTLNCIKDQVGKKNDHIH